MGIDATYFGNNNSYFRPPFVELDGSFNYRLTRNVSVGLAFQNITGIYDGSIQSLLPSNVIGAPTIAGPPYALYGQQYGPRTVRLTLSGSL